MSLLCSGSTYVIVLIVIGLETDSIGNLVTNLSVPKCGNAAEGQKV
jgi:cellulose 1,4-beta-cellobiosidase